MTSTMDVDDRSDSDDDEEIVERGAFSALVVVLMCALHKSYTYSFFFFLVFVLNEREREKGGDRNKFFFCIQRQRTNSKKRNASFDRFRTRSVSFSLQPRVA